MTYNATSNDSPRRRGDSVLVWEFGVPFRALSTGYHLFGMGSDTFGLVGRSKDIADPWTIPAQPVWPGFALNSLFYSGLAWGLWQVPLAIRRRRRRKANRCITCGYDRAGLAGDAACPECGAVARS